MSVISKNEIAMTRSQPSTGCNFPRFRDCGIEYSSITIRIVWLIVVDSQPRERHKRESKYQSRQHAGGFVLVCEESIRFRTNATN